MNVQSLIYFSIVILSESAHYSAYLGAEDQILGRTEEIRCVYRSKWRRGRHQLFTDGGPSISYQPTAK